MTAMQKISAEHMVDPVASHAHRDVVTLREDQTAAEARAKFGAMGASEKIAYLYVLDHEDRLVGVLPVRRLLGADSDAPLQSLMIRPVVSVGAGSSVLEACEVLLEHRLLAVPVVDGEGHLAGVIDLGQFTDDVLTSARKQMDSAFQLIGVHVSLGRRVSSWRSFRDRFPWLLCNIVSGLICAAIASRFELLLSQTVVLAMFLTVVLGLGESVSMQSMTITQQSLLGGRGGWRVVLRSMRKELTTSAMLGAGCGGLIAVTAWLWRGRPIEAAAVGAAICLTIITSCMLGVAVPTAIHKFKVDPRVAAGPIVLASADMATLALYLSVAAWVLGK